MSDQKSVLTSGYSEKMKFRFCGGLEPPDWLLAEVPLLSETSKVKPSDLVAMCQAIGADITVQDLDQAHLLFEDVEDRKAAVAVLRFILTQAAKYDAEARDLVEELQQLGMYHSAAEAIAQSHEDLRPHIQDQQRVQRFRFPNIEKVEWTVKAASKVVLNLKLDQPALECDVTATTATTSAIPELHFDLSKPKFLALYEELSQAQSILRRV